MRPRGWPLADRATDMAREAAIRRLTGTQHLPAPAGLHRWWARFLRRFR